MERSAIDELLERARADLDRVAPEDLAAELAGGALVVDIRPFEQRARDGELAGAMVIDRNVLEWRLTPSSSWRLDGVHPDRRVILVCSQGFSSSLAAATLRGLGLRFATDLEGGFHALRELERSAGWQGRVQLVSSLESGLVGENRMDHNGRR
jgi:rhodanese-related sulfurtransferase